VRRPPRLGSAGGPGGFQRGRRNQAVGFLEGELPRHRSPHASEHRGAEFLLDGLPDYEDDLGEAGAERVVDGVVQQALPVRADSVDLLDSAVAASHARGEHHQRRAAHGRASHAAIAAASPAAST